MLSVVLTACGKDLSKQSISSAKVERSQEGNLIVSWETTNTEIYWGTTPDQTTKGKQSIIINS
ncbi:hypothetical protein MHB81_04605 [Paenibacillus sp. FSL H7-0326]